VNDEEALAIKCPLQTGMRSRGSRSSTGRVGGDVAVKQVPTRELLS